MKSLRTYSAFLIALFVSSAAFAGKDWVSAGSSVPAPAKVTLLSSDINTTSLKIEVSGFNKKSVTTPGGTAFTISLGEASPILKAGAPDLPKVAVPVVIPDASTMKVVVVASSYVDFAGMEIAPSKGTLTRNINPSTVPYTYGTEYAQNEFYPLTQTELRDPYILRDLRGQTVIIYPFRYNPVTKVLRVYTEMRVEISETSKTSSVNVLSRTAPLTKVDREFKNIYLSHFKNAPAKLLYTPVNEDGNMLIISYGPYMADMAPYIEWKNRKGLHTEIVDVAAIGNTSTAIYNYIVNYYNTNGLKYVLLVGDHPHVTTYFINGGEASDPNYGYITGNDSYAEVIVGRFSAESNADVQTQVQRVLNYEKNPLPLSAPWYHSGVGIASDQGPGDDNEMDYEHIRGIRAKLMAFTYSDVAELYDGSQGVADAPGNPDNVDLQNVFNNGISVLNYCGHGSSTALSTTGFDNSDVAQITNENMLPFIWAVACVNGEFTMPGGPCLAEAFMRATNNGQPTGAICTFMSSINQYWDEPMEGQDEMNDILVESYTGNIRRTFGGLSVNGCMKMNDSYGSSGYDMTDTWHCFGDPSIYVRTDIPLPMIVTHIPTVPVGISNLVVNCSDDDAIVALTVDGTIIGTGIVSGGSATISFPAIMVPDTIDVTVTAFNKIPYMGDVIVTSTTGIADLENESILFGVDMNSNLLNVQSFGHRINEIRISNAAGQILPVRIVKQDTESLSIDLSLLSGGIYFAEITASSGKFSRKFFVPGTGK